MLISHAYHCGSAKIFNKEPSGKLRLISRILLCPFILLIYIVYYIVRLCESQAFAEIDRVKPKSELHVLQHKVIANHPPTAESATGWLLWAVKTGTVLVDGAKIEKLLTLRIAERHVLVSPAAILEGFTVWRPKLTRPWSPP